MLPCPALVFKALATFQLVHMNHSQASGSAEGGEVCDPDMRSPGSDVAPVDEWWSPLPSLHVRPSSVRQDSAAGQRTHVRWVLIKSRWRTLFT